MVGYRRNLLGPPYGTSGWDSKRHVAHQGMVSRLLGGVTSGAPRRQHSSLVTPLMQLRPFRSSDLETLSAIDRSCFPASVAYSRQELESFITQPDSRTWVAVEGDTVLGFLVADRRSKDVGHVITIDVLEAWRRRGVGNQLMAAVEHWAETLALRLIYLETAENNVAAQRFYEARGYRRAKMLHDYYANGAAAWVMVKRLDEGPR